MALLEIKFVPDEVLRRKAHKVTNFDASFQAMVDNMIETLRDAPGVGLAAPQIGESIRFVVVEYGDDEDPKVPKRLFTIANPEIVQQSEETETGIEACLSIPGLAGDVQRYKRITVKGLNRRGVPVKYKLSDWLARIFQHEIDHLDGVLFTDRATRIWKPTPEEVEFIKD
jgi:peptide deformylase